MLGIDASAILTATKTFAEAIVKNLTPTVMSLLSSFLIIDLVLSFLFDESENIDIFMKLLKKILYYGFFIWIIQEYSTVVFEYLMGGAIQLGNVASGKGAATEINVELLEKFGISASDIAGLMAAGAGSIILDIFGVEAMATVMLLASVGYLMFFVMLYVQILVTFVKFYLIAGYAYILIPFGVLSKTKDIALKALNGLFSQAIEIFVLITILNLAAFIQDTKWSSIINLPMNSLEAIKANLFTKFAILIFLYLLINKAGSIASSLLSGAIASIGIGAEAGARGFNNAMSAPGKVADRMGQNATAFDEHRKGEGGAKMFRRDSTAANAYKNAANYIKGKFGSS
jgi:P-type conjugative transfer protein trbL